MQKKRKIPDLILGVFGQKLVQLMSDGGGDNSKPFPAVFQNQICRSPLRLAQQSISNFGTMEKMKTPYHYPPLLKIDITVKCLCIVSPYKINLLGL